MKKSIMLSHIDENDLPIAEIGPWSDFYTPLEKQLKKQLKIAVNALKDIIRLDQQFSMDTRPSCDAEIAAQALHDINMEEPIK